MKSRDAIREIKAVLAGEQQWTVIHGDCRELLPLLGAQAVDATITDPPYSDHVHSKSMRGSSLPDTAVHGCRVRRTKDLGFVALSDDLRAEVAMHLARVTRRWVLTFCNVEMAHAWAADLTAADLDYVRTMAWVKLGATPQFTGDRPAAGFETMVLAHPKGGRKKWNGGGKQGVYSVPIEANRFGNRGVRMHTTQKPLRLMLPLVADFTDAAEVILDPFCGAATTGVAAIRQGRRFIGFEANKAWAKDATDRLRAEGNGSTIQAHRAGQAALFGTSKGAA